MFAAGRGGEAGRARRGRMLGSAATALALHGLFLVLLTSRPPARAETDALGDVDRSEPGGAPPAVAVSLARLTGGGPPMASPPKPPTPELRLKPADQEAPLAPLGPPSPPAANQAGPVPQPAAGPELAEAGAFVQPGGMKGCDIAGALQARLQLDPAVGGALRGWPEAIRPAVAARMLWDGRWADTEALGGGDTVEPIRRLVSAVVGAAPSDCLGLEVIGPLAFSAPIGGPGAGDAPSRSLWFTLGSERWRWGELLDAAAPAAGRMVATIPLNQGRMP